MTDDNGEAEGQFTFTRPGRYVIQVASSDGSVVTQSQVIQVLPKCDSKGNIKIGNQIIRASITASVSINEISSLVEESRSFCDLSPDGLKKYAAMEYEKVCETVRNE